MRRLISQLAAIVMLASVMTVVSVGTASAAETIPPLTWGTGSEKSVGDNVSNVVTSPNGNATVGCSDSGITSNLITYNSTGQKVQEIDRRTSIDGVKNCITKPIVDKNSVVYGIPYGATSNGSIDWGPNLLAYSGNTLKWKYPVRCGSSDSSPAITVGADGNIYATTWAIDGMHLIGLNANVAVGQTVPTKKLDIKVDDDCSTELFPYKDGIVLRGQKNISFQYYSYAGKKLVTPSVNQFWDAKINAEGRLFDFQYVLGNAKSFYVSAFDPKSGATVWNRQASSVGANVQYGTVQPLPGGGAAALIREQKVFSGIPTSPTKYVDMLVIMDSNGNKIRSVELAGLVDNNRMVISANGLVTIVRSYQRATGLEYPTTIGALAFEVYNPASNIWPYRKVMYGDMNKLGGPSGYITDSDQALGTGTLFLLANCVNNCDSVLKKLYPLSVYGMGMDYPRGVVLNANTPAQPAPVPTVVVGDSYSAGEGVPPFEYGTDVNGNRCHRSNLAYAKLLDRNPKLAASLEMGSFAACSSAETKHITTERLNGEEEQFRKLNANTKIVTLTIGGNDIGFKAFGIACVLDNCSVGSWIYNATVNNINTVASKLAAAYTKILTFAPNAKIYVLGYPQVAPVKSMLEPPDPRCYYLYSSGPSGFGWPAWGDARAAREIVTQLNKKISDTVNTVRGLNVNNTRLRYIEVNGSTSPFAGHTVCAAPGESYFNNIDPALVWKPEYAVHPNARGQQAYADLVAAEMLAGR